MDDSKDKIISVSVEADPGMRKGAYSNFVSLRSNESDCILDFCFLDAQNPDGIMTGVLVSRIIMKNDQLIDLRDAIDRRIIENSDVSGAEDER